MRLMLFISALAPFAAAACTSDTVTLPSSTPPPSWGVPISGGTMTVSHDGSKAIVSDPDRDRVMFVNLAKQTTTETALQPKDEPGRVIEDAAGRFHVAARRGGVLVDLDANGNILGRRAVCAEPRGLAYDASGDLVHVACTSGELVSFPAAGGAAVRDLHLDRDLRDVMVTSTGLRVTRFRTAEVLTLDKNGNILAFSAVPCDSSPATERRASSRTAATSARLALPPSPLTRLSSSGPARSSPARPPKASRRFCASCRTPTPGRPVRSSSAISSASASAAGPWASNFSRGRAEAGMSLNMRGRDADALPRLVKSVSVYSLEKHAP